MSEHQHYEFLALDQLLTSGQRSALRAISSRAKITSNRFVNQYQYGDLSADPIQMLIEHFDVFFYFANWGAHRLAFKLPASTFDVEAAQPYCGEYLSVSQHGSVVVIEFCLRAEHFDDAWWENEHLLVELVPIRQQLLRGDLRSLFIGWLGGARYEATYGEEPPTPPVPAGLDPLPPVLESLAEFLAVDPQDVVAAAAAAPPAAPELAWEDLAMRIQQMSPDEKDDWLMRLAEGEEPNLSAVFLRFLSDAGRASG